MSGDAPDMFAVRPDHKGPKTVAILLLLGGIFFAILGVIGILALVAFFVLRMMAGRGEDEETEEDEELEVDDDDLDLDNDLDIEVEEEDDIVVEETS